MCHRTPEFYDDRFTGGSGHPPGRGRPALPNPVIWQDRPSSSTGSVRINLLTTPREMPQFLQGGSFANSAPREAGRAAFDSHPVGRLFFWENGMRHFGISAPPPVRRRPRPWFALLAVAAAIVGVLAVWVR
ncbi:conserved hypothetical protein [Magnetospirillum sp. SS-4]|nr:conserved hypothetical protein [Magnetospirillum sp. SS-4]